jgi:hypothetical protein
MRGQTAGNTLPLRARATLWGLASISLLFSLCGRLAAAVPVFATAQQGRTVLSTRDDFVARLSPFDRAAREKSGAPVSEAEYLEFVKANVIEWSDSDRQRVSVALERVQGLFRTASLTFPEHMLLIYTTGKEEGDAAYTRGDAIVLPTNMLRESDQSLMRLLSHETFHVISRHNPSLREKLYQIIGFQACPEFSFPTDLAPRKITNPDAPSNDHRIQVVYQDRRRWAIPVLYADRAAYDTQRGGQFFDYMQFRLVLQDIDDASAGSAQGHAQFVDVKDVRGFFEQVGRNTQYIIHPEEILADNFALAIASQPVVASPSIPKEMLRMMRDEERSRSRRTNAQLHSSGAH